MTQNLHTVRAVKANRPTQEQIKEILERANKISRTSLCLMIEPQIYTR